MRGAAATRLRRRVDLRDPRAGLAERVDGTVLVKAVSDTAETAEMLATAAAFDGLIAGVVGRVDLTADDVGDRSAELRELPGGHLLIGLRHQVEGS